MLKAGKMNNIFAYSYANVKSCEVPVYLPRLKLPAGGNPGWGLVHAGDLEPVPVLCWSFLRVNAGLFVFYGCWLTRAVCGIITK